MSAYQLRHVRHGNVVMHNDSACCLFLSLSLCNMHYLHIVAVALVCSEDTGNHAGEMVFPWMFEDFASLRDLKVCSDCPHALVA